MSSRALRRSVAVPLLAAIAVVSLTGCDPVAWMRRAPSDRPATSGTTASASASGSTSTAATPGTTPSSGTGCADDTAAAGRATVRLEDLPTAASFTSTVARAAGRVVRVAAGTTAFRDFGVTTSTVDGAVLGPAATGLVGAGVARTTFQLVPHSSTKASTIPARFPDTNQLSVLRIAGAGAVLSGFTVRGTDQGHLYNGLRIDAVAGLRASRLRIVGIPGGDSSPPGETFGVNDFRTVASRWTDIEVDGAGVGASGFATNGSKDVVMCRIRSHDNAFAMGFAFWQSSGLHLIDCRADDNGFSGFNFERISGENVLTRPEAHGNRYDMRIASDRGSARFTIIDPHLRDGRWTVTLPKRWYGTANLQRRADITLIVDGRPRPDLLRFATY